MDAETRTQITAHAAELKEKIAEIPADTILGILCTIVVKTDEEAPEGTVGVEYHKMFLGTDNTFPLMLAELAGREPDRGRVIEDTTTPTNKRLH